MRKAGKMRIKHERANLNINLYTVFKWKFEMHIQ